MMGLENWDVQPLTAKEQAQVAHVFGLDQFAYEYRERSGNQLLRQWRIAGTSLQPVLPDMAATIVPPPQCPLIQKIHEARQLSEVGVLRSFSLWDELIPFPMSTLNQLDREGALECTPAEWNTAARDLVGALQKLEQRLFQAEITVLTLHSPDVGPLSVFSHAVRKRFLTLGRLIGSVSELAEKVTGERLAASFQHIEVRVPKAASFPAQVVLLSESLQALGAHVSTNLTSPVFSARESAPPAPLPS